MTLLKIFNHRVKELQPISKKIEKSILSKGWTEERTNQAIEIVRQIKKKDLFITGYAYTEDYNYILLNQLSITLFPSECGIKATMFHEENISQATNYVRNLLDDINKISAPDIYFSIGGHDYEENTTCTFYIDWEF